MENGILGARCKPRPIPLKRWIFSRGAKWFDALISESQWVQFWPPKSAMRVIAANSCHTLPKSRPFVGDKALPYHEDNLGSIWAPPEAFCVKVCQICHSKETSDTESPVAIRGSHRAKSFKRMHGVGIGDLNLWQTAQSMSITFRWRWWCDHSIRQQSKASKLFRMQLLRQNNVLPVLLQLREFNPTVEVLSGHLLLLDDGSTGGTTKSLGNYTMNMGMNWK